MVVIGLNLFFSFGGGFIEAGTGPILTLSYDVDTGGCRMESVMPQL